MIRHLILDWAGTLADDRAPTLAATCESLDIGWFAPAVAAGMDLNQPTRAALELAVQHGHVALG